MQIFFTEYFKKQLKKLIKKFPHIQDDLLKVLRKFHPEHEIHIGRSIYKIRIKSRDLTKGKSGGLRSYIYLYRKQNTLVPICVYSKSDFADVSEKILQYHFDKVSEELIYHFPQS